MAEYTLAEIRAKAKDRPENLVITLDDGTTVTFTHLLMLPTERKDRYLDALESFLALSVDATGNRSERRAADKAAGRKVGTTKAAASAETSEEESGEVTSFTSEDVATIMTQLRDGLLDADKVGDAAGKILTAAILDEKVAKSVLPKLDIMERVTLVNLHLGGEQAGEA